MFELKGFKQARSFKLCLTFSSIGGIFHAVLWQRHGYIMTCSGINERHQTGYV